VGYNPAGLASTGDYRNQFMLGGASMVMVNNFLSLERSARYGARDIASDEYQIQKQLLADLPDEGWRSTFGLVAPLPICNASFGNKAITTNLLYLADYKLSKPALEVIFGGMQKGRSYTMDARCDAMMALEYTYSMGIPYGSYAIGFSLKFFTGLGYYGLDPAHSSGTIVIDTSQFCIQGAGDFLFRESFMGRGYGIDLGILFFDLDGWRMGFTIQNLAALIRWDYPTLTSTLVKDGMLKFMGQQFKNRNSSVNLDFAGESYRYRYEIRPLNAELFFSGDSTYDSLLISSGEITLDTARFSLRLPVVLRLGMSKMIRPDLLGAIDFTASFGERLIYWQGWRVSLGMEYRYFRTLPLRVGASVGGLSGWEVDIGSGIYLGNLRLDWAVGFQHGVWLHTARGFNFAVAAHFLTGKTTRKSR